MLVSVVHCDVPQFVPKHTADALDTTELHKMPLE